MGLREVCPRKQSAHRTRQRPDGPPRPRRLWSASKWCPTVQAQLAAQEVGRLHPRIVHADVPEHGVESGGRARARRTARRETRSVPSSRGSASSRPRSWRLRTSVSDSCRAGPPPLPRRAVRPAQPGCSSGRARPVREPGPADRRGPRADLSDRRCRARSSPGRTAAAPRLRINCTGHLPARSATMPAANDIEPVLLIQRQRLLIVPLWPPRTARAEAPDRRASSR